MALYANQSTFPILPSLSPLSSPLKLAWEGFLQIWLHSACFIFTACSFLHAQQMRRSRKDSTGLKIIAIESHACACLSVRLDRIDAANLQNSAYLRTY